MAGLVINLSSEDLALVASHVAGPPNLSSLDVQKIKNEPEVSAQVLRTWIHEGEN